MLNKCAHIKPKNSIGQKNKIRVIVIKHKAQFLTKNI